MRRSHLCSDGTRQHRPSNGEARARQFWYLSLLCVNLWGLAGPAVARLESPQLLSRCFQAPLPAAIALDPCQASPGPTALMAIVTSQHSVAPTTATSNDANEAPSVLWLIVMPAIPLLWGGLIYLKRAWFAPQDDGPCVAASPDPLAAPPTAGDSASPAAPTEEP